MTLVNPSPIGVVTGPFSATLLRRIESSSSTGSVVAGALEREDAGVVALPVDRHAGRVEDADDRVGDFRADAVAGNERDGVWSWSRTYHDEQHEVRARR